MGVVLECVTGCVLFTDCCAAFAALKSFDKISVVDYIPRWIVVWLSFRLYGLKQVRTGLLYIENLQEKYELV